MRSSMMQKKVDTDVHRLLASCAFFVGAIKQCLLTEWTKKIIELLAIHTI